MAELNADAINERMEALANRLDRVGEGAEPRAVADVNASLSAWQDFYWGELDQWPVSELAIWEGRLPTLEAQIIGLEQQAGRRTTPVVSAPSTAPTQVLEPLKVVATWPLWMKVAAGGALTIIMYKVARKVHLL